MPLDTWQTNSAFEIGTLALRPSHHVSAIAHITNRSMTPDAGPSHPLAPKRPMTEGVQLATATSSAGGKPVRAAALKRRFKAAIWPRSAFCHGARHIGTGRQMVLRR